MSEPFFDLDRACREVFLFTGADASELEQFLVASGDADHLLRVAHISWTIAKAAGFDDPDRVWLCGLLHDIGKVTVSDSVVAKPCALTHDEKILMREHVEAGCAIVTELMDDTSPELRRVVIDGIRCHHERWDGSGYPDGLAGSSIPIAARIVAVADVLDAVTSEPPFSLLSATRTASARPAIMRLRARKLPRSKGALVTYSVRRPPPCWIICLAMVR